MLVAGTLHLDDGTSVARVPLAAGQTYLRPAGVRHDVQNGSDHPVAFIEIEIKRPGDLAGLMLQPGTAQT